MLYTYINTYIYTLYKFLARNINLGPFSPNLGLAMSLEGPTSRNILTLTSLMNSTT